MKCTIFQSLRKNSISGLGVALFSILLVASTAQAQQCSVVQNGSSFRAVCPLDSDKGYVYDWLNNQWRYSSYYTGMTTNFPKQYLYAYALWVGTDRSTGVTYAYTISGWWSLNLQNEALRLFPHQNELLTSTKLSPKSALSLPIHGEPVFARTGAKT